MNQHSFIQLEMYVVLNFKNIKIVNQKKKIVLSLMILNEIALKSNILRIKIVVITFPLQFQ